MMDGGCYEDSSYNSTSENELDSDPEDPERLLNEWLGELNTLTGGLDTVASCALRPLNSHLNTPRIDSYRFSMANLEDSQDTELDAILGELCALENQYDQALSVSAIQRNKQQQQSVKKDQLPSSDINCKISIQQTNRLTHSRSSSEGNKLKIENNDSVSMGEHIQKNDIVVRTDSPDNDSAFSDNVSMLSSESSASSGGSAGGVRMGTAQDGKGLSSPISQHDTAGRVKAEKIRIALEKMREASVKKLFIKAFTGDGSSKSLLVDETMSAGHVARMLADKNHTAMDPRWGIVEHLPELHMERVYEDHEPLVENLMMWTRDSKNKLLFLERNDKVQLFQNPEAFLLPTSSACKGGEQNEYDDHARALLLEEFFSSAGGCGVPEVEGPLYLKADSKKGWKRHHFVLRASGLYYLPKEKSKSSASSARDLSHLASFDVNQVYYGVGWKKKYKAPTDFCFAIKHPRLQQPKSTKYIKFLCADDESSLQKWVVGIRLAKFGRQLMENYKSLVDELAQDDLDQLAHARSCSVSSIAPTSSQSVPQSLSNGNGQTEMVGDGTSSSSSSGCLSDGCCGSGGGSSTPAGFECDFPTTGTIKRKPSVNPKLPLTSITRQLKEVGETVSIVNIERTGSVRRRRSGGSATSPDATDSGSNSSTLKRHQGRRGGSASSSSDASTPVREEEILPPPPAEMLVSTLSLDSLPPPPPPLEQDFSGSQLSLVSLPPPPPPYRPPPTPPLSGSSTPTNCISPPPTCLSPTRVTTLPYIAELRTASPVLSRHTLDSHITNALPPSSPTNRSRTMVKKISFAEPDIQQSSHSLPNRKPLPPRRSESTRLSSVQPPRAPLTPPPREFLKDLQRVMKKKWQIAQKCKLDTSTTPHEVLGFRDPPPPPPPPHPDYRETNVSNWVQEHYGRDNLYENVYLVGGGQTSQPIPSEYTTAPILTRQNSVAASIAAKKRPPPPPPKRSETTQLSSATRQQH